MDAIVYIRWSTQNQEDGNSLQRQEELARRIAEVRNYTITEIHVERGKSAYHGRNRSQSGKLRQIEERAERGELAGKVLIVEAMDRLSRQEPLESLNLLVGLCKRGLTICEAGSGIIYDTAKINENWANLIVALAKAGEAHDSSKIKARRVTSAWRKTQELGRTKEGKADPRMCPYWMEVVDGEFQVIEQRADIIRMIFDMSANGTGLRTIANKANAIRDEIGWPQQLWNIRFVSMLLKSRRVLGEYVPFKRTENYGREEVGPPRKIYPAIISTETWYQVQQGLEQRRGTGGPRQKTVNLLSHIARCYHRPTVIGPDGKARQSAVPCGSKMVLRSHKAQKATLTCSEFARAGNCKSNKTYIYPYILTGILDNIGSYIASAPPRADDTALAHIAIQRAELHRMEQRLEVLADKMMEEDDPVLMASYQKFKAKVREAELDIKAMQVAQESKQATIPAVAAASELQELRDQPDSVEVRQRMQVLLDNLIDAVFMNPDDRTATVVMLGGLASFKLSKKGELLQSADALNQLDVATDKPIPDRITTDPVRKIAIERSIEVKRKAVGAK